MQTIYDVLIIGSGAAGLAVALSVADAATVCVITKDDLLTSASRQAQGGIAAVMSETDSVEAHIEDTMIAGCGLCDPLAVETTVRGARAAIEWLMQGGVQFTPDVTGALHLTQEGGHRCRRIVHAQDQTGAAVVRTLAEQVLLHPQIVCRVEHVAIDLGVHNRRVQGVWVFDPRTGERNWIGARTVILATGGANRLYPHATSPSQATGDGMGIAWRAGCRLVDLEFQQFHPTSLYHPDSEPFLLTEALRGEGAYLVLPSGERFMARYDARMELAPRDIVSRAIYTEMQRLNLSHVYLDIRHRPREEVAAHFPAILAACKARGLDLCRELMPVVPAAHYTCGGILTNLRGETDIVGLYAVGETACTGLHGANRMASNSLLECVVFARRVAEALLEQLSQVSVEWIGKSVGEPWGDISGTCEIAPYWEALHHMMWQNLGIIREEAGLQVARTALRALKQAFDQERVAVL